MTLRISHPSKTTHKPHKAASAVLFSIAAMCSLATSAQIQIQKYPLEITCDVESLTPIQAESSFGGLVVHLEEEIFSGGCAGTLVRTFHFEDKTGAKAQAVQTVHLTDVLPPDLIGVPSNVSVTSDKIPKAYPVDARDNSGSICTVNFEEVVEERRITRIWTTTDPCGNVTTAKQIITILK
jgi:hypothetical protein